MLPLLLLSVLLTLAFGQEPTDSWTTNYGAPVQDNDQSLTVGLNGPTLLNDYVLIEKLANFDRERIPERVVHAVGASAKGYFTVTADVSNYTFADFLQPDRITPAIVRFSTVIPSRGGPETARDPRGFATKFYTNEGNYDLVGNNFPVFFIRDGMKFPDMVHSLKPNPITNQQEWWRIWDFFSSHPESMHMFTFLLDDEGIPADFRHMNGAGVHTFRWISANGSEMFVKYTWESHQGVQNLETDEKVKNILNPSHATLDLHTSIKSGDFPKWSLLVQLLDPNETDTFDFDPLDPTKIWPTDLIPAMEIGVLVLNETINNFFAENELLAFSPSNIVPGIDYSEDKLLQSRLFSYPDTQRYRIGGNYLLLPANAPRCPFQNHHYEGVMNFGVPKSAINYFPSQLNGLRNAPEYPTASTVQTGSPTRGTIVKTNNFQQPGERYRSFDKARRLRFIERLVGTLKDPQLTEANRDTIISYWAQVDNVTLGPALREAFAAVTPIISPKEHDYIEILTITTLCVTLAAPIVSSFMINVPDTYFSFKTATLHLQLVMIPILVNKELGTVRDMFKYIGIIALTPPVHLNFNHTTDAFLGYGDYLFPKAVFVLGALILVAFFTRTSATYKGVRIFGVDVLFHRTLRIKVALVCLTPLVFSIFAVALNIYSADHGHVFSYSYVIWNSVVAVVALACVYEWYQSLASIYHSFGASPHSTIVLGGKNAANYKSVNFAVFVDADNSDGWRRLSVPSDVSREDQFKQDYGALFLPYKAAHCRGPYHTSLENLQSVWCHQFEFITTIHVFTYIILSTFLWKTWIGVLVNVIQQVTFILASVFLQPHRTWHDLIIAYTSNLFLAGELLLLVVFIHDEHSAYLFAFAVLCLVSVIVSQVIIPILFNYVFKEVEEDSKDSEVTRYTEVSPLVAHADAE